MKINAILAATRDGVIGKDNDLIWNISEDLKRFRDLTKGSIVIMGRKTYESIVSRLGKPLPGRVNIVISGSNLHQVSADLKQKQFKDTYVVPSLDEAYRLAECLAPQWLETAWVIGGAQVYIDAFRSGRLNEVYLTEVHNYYEGDAIVDLNVLKKTNWRLTELEMYGDLGYSFKKYINLDLDPYYFK
jgi:dihydrofolate reductase